MGLLNDLYVKYCNSGVSPGMALHLAAEEFVRRDFAIDGTCTEINDVKLLEVT